MSSLPSVIGAHLNGMGLSTDLLSSITSNLKANDIISVALRLALIGILGAALRRGLVDLKAYIFEFIFPTAYIASTDPAFSWVMAFLAQDNGVQKQTRSFRLITADSRESKRDDAKRNTSNKERKESLLVSKTDASFAMDDVIGQIVPVNERNILVTLDNQWIWVTRSTEGYVQSTQRDVDHLKVRALVTQTNAIKNFLIAAHESYFKKSDSEILIFHASPYAGSWYDPISRPARTWRSVILPETTKNELLSDVQSFLSDEDKEWYAARGIPHRRGYLLHGRPGSGKTTLATAVASQLKLDIYVINPAARGMDDGKLNKVFRSCPPGNMILIEDIDCVMPKRAKDVDGEKDDDDEEDESTANVDPGKYGLAKSTVTLSGLLNAIDGVSSQEDCILFATTNHPNRLDHALSRPGRFDVRLPFFDATRDQATALFRHFYPVEELNQKDGEKAVPRGEQLEDLAAQFTDAVFIHGAAFAVSMASLQGYLLQFKKDPCAAARGAESWVQGLHEEETAKKNAKLASKQLVSPVSFQSTGSE